MAAHNHLEWKELSRQTVFKSAFAETQLRDYQLPDGKTLNEYAMFIEANGVAIVAQTEEGKLLFVRQFRPAPAIVTIDFAGGAVEKGEDPFLAAKRELLEETGYESNDWKALGELQPAQHRLQSTLYVFLVKNCQKVKEIAGDASEFLENVQYSASEVEQMIHQNQITCSICIASYFRAQRHLK